MSMTQFRKKLHLKFGMHSPEDIKHCSENSFTYLFCDEIGTEFVIFSTAYVILSRSRIGTEFCSSKLIALCVISKYFA